MERSRNAEDSRSIIKDVLEACAGPEDDHFRRLLRNFIACCLGRGSWTEDLDKPMPLEEFAMLYDNYPQWITNERKNAIEQGLKEGREAALVESMKEGMKEGMNEGMKAGMNECRREERIVIFS